MYIAASRALCLRSASGHSAARRRSALALREAEEQTGGSDGRFEGATRKHEVAALARAAGGCWPRRSLVDDGGQPALSAQLGEEGGGALIGEVDAARRAVRGDVALEEDDAVVSEHPVPPDGGEPRQVALAVAATAFWQASCTPGSFVPTRVDACFAKYGEYHAVGAATSSFSTSTK